MADRRSPKLKSQRITKVESTEGRQNVQASRRERTMKTQFTAVFAIFLILSSTTLAVYNPQLGRFVQRDPMGAVNTAVITPLVDRGAAFKPAYPLPRPTAEYRNGMNLYQYADSCPLVYVDPTGQSVVGLLIAVLGVIASAITARDLPPFYVPVVMRVEPM